MGNWDVKWDKFVRSFIEYGAYKDVLEGLKATILIAVFGLLIGIIIGTIIASVKLVPNSKVAKFFSKIFDIYVGFFRGTPIVVQLLVIFYVVLPMILRGIGATSTTNPVIVAIVVFGMNSGAYVSEIMRSGIQSVDKGQMEAGRAMGLTYNTSMMRIVLPQAVKNILPTIGNEFISLVKETSVVSFITVTDLYKAFRSIGAGNYEFMVPYLMLALIYLVMILIITFFVRMLERRLRKSDRSN